MATRQASQGNQVVVPREAAPRPAPLGTGFAHEGRPQRPLTPWRGGISRGRCSPLGTSLTAPRKRCSLALRPTCSSGGGSAAGAAPRLHGPGPERDLSAPAGVRHSGGSSSLRALRSHSCLCGPNAAVRCGSRQGPRRRRPLFPLPGPG